MGWQIYCSNGSALTKDCRHLSCYNSGAGYIIREYMHHSTLLHHMQGMMPGTAVVFVGSTRSSGSEDLGNPAVRAAAATRFGVMLVILLLRTVI